MTTRDLTIKIRTSLNWTDLMAGLELVADSADNITVDVMPVKRSYKKKPKPKSKRHPELEYERSPSHSHNGEGDQYDRISVYASCKKNNLPLCELMDTTASSGSWQHALKSAAMKISTKDYEIDALNDDDGWDRWESPLVLTDPFEKAAAIENIENYKIAERQNDEREAEATLL